MLVWSALFFMAGMRLIWVFGIAGIAAIGMTAAYFTVPHVASRIQKFVNPALGDTFNIDIATESFMRGGWFGKGPGEGTVKPDPGYAAMQGLVLPIVSEAVEKQVTAGYVLPTHTA